MAKTLARHKTTETVLTTVGGWRLAVGGWRLAVGGWRLAVGGPWGLCLRAVLNQKKLGFFRTALGPGGGGGAVEGYGRWPRTPQFAQTAPALGAAAPTNMSCWWSPASPNPKTTRPEHTRQSGGPRRRGSQCGRSRAQLVLGFLVWFGCRSARVPWISLVGDEHRTRVKGF